MKVEVSVTIVVDSDSGQWHFVVGDALRDVGNEIYRNPKNVVSQGDGTVRLGDPRGATSHYLYEYTIKGQA